MSANVFVYGTLMFNEVMSLVTAQNCSMVSAKLTGYARRSLHGRVYPGIVQQEQSTVEGGLYVSISKDALRRLDFFEGEEYERLTVNPILSTGETVMAQAYVIPDSRVSTMSTRCWNLDQFRKDELPEYLTRVERIMSSYFKV